MEEQITNAGISDSSRPKNQMLLTQEIRQNNSFNKFIDSQIKLSDKIKQPLDGNLAGQRIKKLYDIYSGELKYLSEQNSDLSITTKEFCSVPCHYLQSETTRFSDGSKIIVRYFPISEKPAKKIHISADGLETTTTIFNQNGEMKNIIKTIINPDGSGREENTEVKFSRKNVRKFDKDGVTLQVISYVGDKITFRLDCDEDGNLRHEYNFYTYMDEGDLKPQKEVIHHKDGSYTTKEYNIRGCVNYSETFKPQQKKGFLPFNLGSA